MSNINCHDLKTSYKRDDYETPFDFICEFDKRSRNDYSEAITTTTDLPTNIKESQGKGANQSEFTVLLPNHPIAVLPVLTLNLSNFHVPMVACPSGHVTRDYLSCDIQSGCVTDDRLEFCKMQVIISSSDEPLNAGNTLSSDEDSIDISSNMNKGISGRSSSEVTFLDMPMFTCTTSGISISYTLVCDYENQCYDGSDEDFCVFDECSLSGKICFRSVCIKDRPMLRYSNLL